MLTIQQKGVILLIKSALENQAYPLLEGFSLESVENLILHHQVPGLVYEGAVLCGVDKKSPAMKRLFQQYYRHMLRSEKQMRAVKDLLAAFEEHQIDYLLVKGSVMKMLYPNPAMRVMGDADILIRIAQYEQIKPLMLQLGYQAGHESDHEMVWDSDELHLELHKRLISSENKDYYGYIGEGWEHAYCVSEHRYALKNEVMFVYLLLHFAKHYRCGGIGLRQAIDLWLYEKKTPMDQTRLQEELEKVNMLDFYSNIHKMLECWFEDGQWDEKSDFISEFLFSSGSWGTAKNKLIGQGLRSSKKAGSVKKARGKMLLETIFQPLKLMRNRYTILRKLPWLLPVYWPIRWVEALLFRRENIRNYRSNMKTTSVERIDSFEESLQYVGLSVDI